MTRVLVVTTNLAGPGGGPGCAAGSAWRPAIEALGRLVDGTVVAPRSPGAPDSEWLGGLHVVRAGPQRPAASLEDAARSPAMPRVAAVSGAQWARAASEVRTGAYDVVHAMWALPSGLACTWPAPRVPVLLSLVGSDLHRLGRHALAGPLVRAVVRRADVVAVTGALGERRAIRCGARNVRVVEVPYDDEVFRECGPAPADPVVAYVGRLTRSKGLDVLAGALERLAASTPGLRFVCCGDGPDAPSFRARVAAALPGRCEFLGNVAPSLVAAALARSRVLALPSHGEGLPSAVLEALACGRAVVATAAGDHAALVARGGALAAARAGAFAAALADQLRRDQDPSRLAAMVAAHAPRAVAARIAALYDELAGSPRRAVA